MARGTTGAPRNTPDPDVPADGGDIRAAETQDVVERGPGNQQTRPGDKQTSSDQGRPGRPRGANRLIAFICGRRTKWVVVAFWLLVVVVLGSLAGPDLMMSRVFPDCSADVRVPVLPVLPVPDCLASAPP